MRFNHRTFLLACLMIAISALSVQAQREAIVGGLQFGESQPKVATYDIREFVY